MRQFDYLEDESIPIDEYQSGNKDHKKELQHIENCSYNAYGEIKGMNPTVLDCGDIDIEIVDERLKNNGLLGKYIVIPIERLDIF